MIKKCLGHLLVFIGIVILISPILKDVYIKHQQKKIISNYTYAFENTSYLFEDLSYLEDIRQDNNYLTPESLYYEENQPTKNENSLPKDVLGIITISKINVKLPVYYDATPDNLKKGAAIVKGTVFPPKGNTVIAAHRGRTYGSYFNRLQELEVGDRIVLTFNNTSFTYEIYEIFIVEPSEVWVLNNTEQPIITLITCHPQSGTHRLIVRGKIID